VTRAGLLRVLLGDLDTHRDPNSNRWAVTSLVHSEQTATRALRDGATSEWIAVALLHDVLHTLAPATHPEAVAVLLADRLSADARAVLACHGEFQHDAVHGTHRTDRHRSKGWYSAATRFAHWDALSFDPLFTPHAPSMCCGRTSSTCSGRTPHEQVPQEARCY